jgi:carbon-monoxide dehydrogenase medium subunit
VITSGGGQRTVPVNQFFTGLMTTALGEGDLLTAIEVPAQAAGQGSAYVKFEHPASRYAVLGVAAVVGVSGGTCKSAAIAVGGLVPRPARAASVERRLVGQALADAAVAAAAAEVGADLGGDIIGDIYASAEYRKAVAPVWVKKAVAAAAARVR